MEIITTNINLCIVTVQISAYHILPKYAQPFSAIDKSQTGEELHILEYMYVQCTYLTCCHFLTDNQYITI